HNLSGDRFMLLSTEDRVAYVEHINDYVERFQPADSVERDLVDRLIAASWRDKRMDSMEASLFEIIMEEQEEDVRDRFEDLDETTRQTLSLLGTTDISRALNLLLRYQAGARRSYSAALRALKELQGDR